MNSWEENRKVRKINIAIDGHSSCGKSSTSKLLAARLHYKYIDTGAMYRAVTLYILENGVNGEDEHELAHALDSIEIDFRLAGDSGSRTILNGRDVEEAIRTMEVSGNVSAVSTISAVRRKLVEQQREIARGKGVVMDGRDIGTVVLPDAELKVFMTAAIEVRAERRYLELQQNGVHTSLSAVMENLAERDRIDSSREDSPLRKADDAIVLDTSGHTLKSQTDWLYERAMALIHPSSPHMERE
jgi:cytidylate kinase